MFNYVFPTCIWADRQSSLAKNTLPVAIEYLEKYGTHFRGDNNYVTTYYSGDCSDEIIKDTRFKPLVEYITTVAFEFLKHEHVDVEFFRDSINNTKFIFINKTLKGGSHPIHAHPKSLLSGSFYLKTSEDSSPIIFQDPRDYYKYNYYPLVNRNISSTFSTEVVVPAIEGDIMMWPSWLEHQVLVSESDSERIGIAFNIGHP